MAFNIITWLFTDINNLYVFWFLITVKITEYNNITIIKNDILKYIEQDILINDYKQKIKQQQHQLTKSQSKNITLNTQLNDYIQKIKQLEEKNDILQNNVKENNLLLDIKNQKINNLQILISEYKQQIDNKNIKNTELSIEINEQFKITKQLYQYNKLYIRNIKELEIMSNQYVQQINQLEMLLIGNILI